MISDYVIIILLIWYYINVHPKILTSFSLSCILTNASLFLLTPSLNIFLSPFSFLFLFPFPYILLGGKIRVLFMGVGEATLSNIQVSKLWTSCYSVSVNNICIAKITIIANYIAFQTIICSYMPYHF